MTNECLNVYQIFIAPQENNFLHTVVAGLQICSSAITEVYTVDLIPNQFNCKNLYEDKEKSFSTHT